MQPGGSLDRHGRGSDVVLTASPVSWLELHDQNKVTITVRLRRSSRQWFDRPTMVSEPCPC
jgi:hypothetical protein